MKALIFAAGRGERMRPLTDTLPKPLLMVGGKRLIEWHLERLAAAGIVDIVVNIAHLAARFDELIGDGRRHGVRITYSHEGSPPLETGGGMLHALPLLGEAPFVLVNGDVWTDHDFRQLPPEPDGLAHLVMVDPPAFAPDGDFALDRVGRVHDVGEPRLTYAGIGVYRPAILAGWRGVIGHAPGARELPPRFALTPLLRAAMRDGQVTGEHHRGRWADVGTPDRLAAADSTLSASSSLTGASSLGSAPLVATNERERRRALPRSD
jgi:MurNAc alpha-1-phosphate uridylyltransferase